MWQIRLIRKREVWWPTRLGWCLMIVAAASPIGLLCWGGESFLAVTARVPADVLVVEGWIGREAIAEAAKEFQHGGYSFVVATGGYTSSVWGSTRRSYTEIARRGLLSAGIPEDQVLLAEAHPSEGQRTFRCAAAVRELFSKLSLQPRGINVFTRGPHARRSRMVHRKVQDIPVGVIGWMPERLHQKPWWSSSERTKDLITEGCGYVFEAVLNSGRLNNRQKATSASMARDSSS
jgi:hypothetical protein